MAMYTLISDKPSAKKTKVAKKKGRNQKSKQKGKQYRG